MTKNLRTTTKPTWCPGCFNFQILAGVEQFLKSIDLDKPENKHAIVTGIGCHAKIFDYLNLPGLYGLHGRPVPVCQGMKISNPDLNVIGFSGDGDAYNEGIAHLIHAARYNTNFTYLIHNNQVFALTVSQPTAVTETNFKDKTTPFGVKTSPINPIQLMLAAGASFVARVFADVNQVKQILEQAHKHKGFKFIEILQPCIIFHPDKGYKELTYNLQEQKHNTSDFQAAMKKAQEFNYQSITKDTKIPLGIFYQVSKPVFEEALRKRE